MANNLKSSLFALVDCNNFYVSCERVFNPTLKNKPVIILSNNDGCAVAMSNEAKSLGIKTGIPIFKIRDLVKTHDIRVFSSNYTLYGDMSNRVMKILSGYTAEIEIYSIDECFLSFAYPADILTEFCLNIKAAVKRYTGIPVSVGIASTKTLAKIANRIAKNNPEYSGVLAFCPKGNISQHLERTRVEDVWGIGEKYASKLKNQGIKTANQLKNTPYEWAGVHLGGIVGQRTIQELRGHSCLSLETTTKSKNEIVSSKSFGVPISNLQDLKQAVSSYMALAAHKLRSENSLASIIHVFILTNRFKKEPQYGNFSSFCLPFPTAYTPELTKYAIKTLASIYKPGYHFKKAGVMLSGLVPNNLIQKNLFIPHLPQHHSKMMQVMDYINEKWGRNSLYLASSGIEKPWTMSRKFLSSRYTTNWDELLTVRI